MWRSIHVLGAFAFARTRIDEHYSSEIGNVGLELATRHAGTARSVRWHLGAGFRAWLPAATGYRAEATHDTGRLLNPPLRLNAAHHVYDPGRFAPYTTTLRPGVAVAGVTEWAFVQVDVGADVFIPTDEPEPMAREAGYHVGVAAGPRMGPFTGYAELAYFKCTTCAVDPDGRLANHLLGFVEPPPAALVFGFRADLGACSVGIALRDHLGEIEPLHSVPWRADVLARF